MRLTLTTAKVATAIAGAVLAAGFAAAPARADVVGELTCNISPGVGAIIASNRAVACTFHSPQGPVQLYRGSISRLGVDIGALNSGVLTYAVTALGTPAPGSLTGDYFGPGFGLTLGTGASVNALVGGGNSFSLQPLSATRSTGVNFNAGVGELHLAYIGSEPVGPRHRRFHHHRMM